MNKFMEYEKQVIDQYVAGLLDFPKASGRLVGYIRCLTDMGEISKEDELEKAIQSIRKLSKSK